MILAPVYARAAFADGRLDAKYFCSPGVRASEFMVLLRASGVQFRTVAGKGGMGEVAPLSRTKRVYAAPGEESLPYLRPYDVFDYLPQSADLLAKAGGSDLDRLMPAAGTILQTCSGRNLGPLAYADKYIEQFVVSDDMLRLVILDEHERFYTLAFLSTPSGQALLTRSKTGGVIDHLSADDLAAVQVPFFDSGFTAEIAGSMRRAVNLRESARMSLDRLIREYTQATAVPQPHTQLKNGWTQRASLLRGRIDSAYYDPRVAAIRSALSRRGGVRVGDVAETFIPGRYKRYYVESDHGRPIVSGRQLLQSQPVNLRHIASRSFDFSDYELTAGMVAFGAEGRAEERISQPSLITRDRAGWLANNHVMRVRPKDGVNAGWLYLSFAIEQVQAQVRASACGSVVDAVYPSDLDDVLLPPVDNARGDRAQKCWDDLAEANQVERAAIQSVEDRILAVAGIPS